MHQGPTGPPAPAPAPAKIATTGHHRNRPKIRDLAGGLAGDFYQIFSLKIIKKDKIVS